MSGRTGSSRDRSHDVLGLRPNPLAPFFNPKTVAVIGATEKEGSVGRALCGNLLRTSFGGEVFAVNPKRDSILGLKAWPKVFEIPRPVDLAVIVTPANSVPDLIDDCVKAKIKAVVIVSAGFKETGPEGAVLEAAILAKARAGSMRVVGPNCLGVMNPWSGLNATFAHGMARQGQVALVSQSGALITAVLDWSLQAGVGFSSIVSLGSMLDVSWADMIDYLGNDANTRSIALYMESIGDARAFISAAREVALAKPIIVIKAGRSPAAAKAAASHTGSLAGSHDVLEAAFRRCGILSVDHISDLFHATDMLAKQPRPRGPRLCIVTNAGGPGVLATDALVEGGGQLAELSEELKKRLDAFLPAAWSHGDPVDVLGDADPARFTATAAAVATDGANDGILVILTPQAMTDPEATARQLVSLAKLGDRPILSSWMGGGDVASGRALLSQAGIPCFEFPDTACRIFNMMWSYGSNLASLYEAPGKLEEGPAPDSKGAQALLEGIRGSGRTLLTEFEAKQLLAAYGIPVVPTRLAPTADDAVERAKELGYPVVLKLNSLTLTHKTDVGGVKLDLADDAQVRSAFEAIRSSVMRLKGAEHFQGVTVQTMAKAKGYEVILGSSLDPQVGPVLLFGSGGELVEVYKDRALGLPPLNRTLARRLMERTKIYTALKGVRGREPVDLPALEQLLVRFSQLISEQPLIKELDINPLLASPEALLALDARVLLHDDKMPMGQLPGLAIRPYPSQYISSWSVAGHPALVLRPIRPEDESLLVKFHEGLSAASVYSRYLHDMELSARVAHERLLRICCVDYARDMVLVAEGTEVSGEKEIVAVGRLSRLGGGTEAELSVLIADRWQKMGLGSRLLGDLLRAGKAEGLVRVLAHMLPENQGMRRVCAKAGFKEEAGAIAAELTLTLDL
jgi:acetyltransferase